MENVGKINLKSGTVIISDPCYERGTWCAGYIDNVKSGEWNCFVRKSDEGSWGVRNAAITAVHDEINPDNIIFHDEQIKKERSDKLREIEGKETKYLFWELTDIDVGVDSGQAGMFDIQIYPSNKAEQGEYGDSNSFYGKCCDNTLNDEGCGVMEGGFVSRSGYGDGSYHCWISKKDNQVVAIQIEFIAEELDEEIINKLT